MPPIGSWTPERVEKLRVLWAEGLSAAEIAKALGEPILSRNSIISKANRTPGFERRVSHHFVSGADHKRSFKGYRELAENPGRPRKDGTPARRKTKEKAKRVTLPPLPINGPVLTSDTKLLKSAAWLVLPGAPEPKPLWALGDVGRPGHPGECRWPIGENPTLFCGCTTEKTYCAAHAKVAYKPKVTA